MKYHILLLLIIIYFFKYIILFFSFIPTKIWMKRRKRQFKSLKINNEPLVITNPNWRGKVKMLIGRYIEGYIRYSLFQIAMIPSHRIRNWLYVNIYLVKLGKHAIIYFGAEIRAPYNLEIGKGSIIGDKSILDARNGIEIGYNVNFSSNVQIWTEQHDHRDAYFGCNSTSDFKVIIRDRVWIGPNVTILHGVIIGEGAVVAAGAVVTKSVEPFAIVAGIPAKKIAERTHNLKYEFNGPPSPFY